MKAPQTLRRPANWQDFETLCKKLWGEIWNCPEIQKNGRLGQEQAGVDVFGIPAGEAAYYGIQCKGKTEYNDKHLQFTEAEIKKEIEKAKTFDPKLKKFYLATTALNDVKIQAFVRQKNIEHLHANLFEVHLFCWESIAELIDEHKATHDWYVKSQNFKNSKSVKLTFEDDSTNLTKNVKFQQKVVMYVKEQLQTIATFQGLIATQNGLSIFAARKSLQVTKKINRTNCFFALKLHNTGADAIENYKIQLRFEGNYRELERAEEREGFISYNISKIYQAYIEQDGTAELIPIHKMLVGDDTHVFDKIRIKPNAEPSDITIHWKLISKDFKDEGKLTLRIVPEIVKKRTTVVLEDKAGLIEYDPIEDYVVEKVLS
jgi:hypothetical protein